MDVYVSHYKRAIPYLMIQFWYDYFTIWTVLYLRWFQGQQTLKHDMPMQCQQIMERLQYKRYKGVGTIWLFYYDSKARYTEYHLNATKHLCVRLIAWQMMAIWWHITQKLISGFETYLKLSSVRLIKMNIWHVTRLASVTAGLYNNSIQRRKTFEPTTFPSTPSSINWSRS